MTFRFLFQKFSSGDSRSASLLGAHASASATAAAPFIPCASAARYFKIHSHALMLMLKQGGQQLECRLLS
uniref:Uncharacterized protein n=1 Tax=Arundo donax TaxID=35708 RepID=A0A0A9BLI3_ARUDO